MSPHARRVVESRPHLPRAGGRAAPGTRRAAGCARRLSRPRGGPGCDADGRVERAVKAEQHKVAAIDQPRSVDATYVALFQYRLGADLIGVDETWWRLIVCDGYRAYETLAKKRPGLRLAHCWAHVRDR